MCLVFAAHARGTTFENGEIVCVQNLQKVGWKRNRDILEEGKSGTDMIGDSTQKEMLPFEKLGKPIIHNARIPADPCAHPQPSATLF